jgi:hypothetical protein
MAIGKPRMRLWVLCAASLLATMSVARLPAAALTASPQRAVDGTTGDLPADRQAQADRRAEAAIDSVCTVCHPVENIVRSRRSRMDWDALVAKMVIAGAVGTDEQLDMIRRYLTRYYGSIRVNRASAGEFSAVLGYSSSSAAAIVAFRQARGPFEDREALAKVPGLDRARLDAQPDALKFD